MSSVNILRKASIVGVIAACVFFAGPSMPSAEAWHGPFFHAGYGGYGPRVTYRVGYVSHYRYPYASYGYGYYPGSSYRVVAPYSYYAYPVGYYSYPGGCYGTGYHGAYYGGPMYYSSGYGGYYGW